MVYELNQVLRGWAGYFCLGPVSTAYRKVNSHVRWRFRRWWERKHERLIQRPALVLESLAGGEVWSAPVEVGPLAPAARESVNLLREPDAANPQVRFDEREVETEQGKAIEAPATERAGQRIRPNLNHRATSRLYPRQQTLDRGVGNPLEVLAANWDGGRSQWGEHRPVGQPFRVR
jgi:hypothetical protein